MFQFKQPLAGDALLWQDFLGQYKIYALAVAHEVGLFDALRKHPCSMVKLAQQLQLNQRALAALSTCLSAMGYLLIVEGEVKLSDVGKTYFTNEFAGNWSGRFAELKTDRLYQRVFAGITDTHKLMHGDNEFTQMWESGDVNDEAAKLFTHNMHCMISSPSWYALNSGLFDDVNALLDIGGASAIFAARFIHRHPDKRAGLFELPGVLKVSQDFIDNEYQMSDKITCHAGDFFKDEFPLGYDAILFGNILHDWPVATCNMLLAKAYAALPTGGYLYLHEMLFTQSMSSSERLTVSLFDLLMYINHRSQQFHIDELTDMLNVEGFGDVVVRKTSDCYSVLRAQKI